MSKTSASDRIRVGRQLERLPRVAAALSSGEIGFQAASVICHLEDRISEVGASVDQDEWVGMARAWSLKDLSREAAGTWHGVDPAGFNAKVEEAHERRQLFVSECGDMYRLDGWLEIDAGAAVKRRSKPWPARSVRTTGGLRSSDAPTRSSRWRPPARERRSASTPRSRA